MEGFDAVRCRSARTPVKGCESRYGVAAGTCATYEYIRTVAPNQHPIAGRATSRTIAAAARLSFINARSDQVRSPPANCNVSWTEPSHGNQREAEDSNAPFRPQ